MDSVSKRTPKFIIKILTCVRTILNITTVINLVSEKCRGRISKQLTIWTFQYKMTIKITMKTKKSVRLSIWSPNNMYYLCKFKILVITLINYSNNDRHSTWGVMMGAGVVGIGVQSINVWLLDKPNSLQMTLVIYGKKNIHRCILNPNTQKSINDH